MKPFQELVWCRLLSSGGEIIDGDGWAPLIIGGVDPDPGFLGGFA